MRTVALALAMMVGPSVLTVSAQTNRPPASKPVKSKKPKNTINKRGAKQYQKSHNIPSHKAPKHPKAAAHQKPPKPPKHHA